MDYNKTMKGDSGKATLAVHLIIYEVQAGKFIIWISFNNLTSYQVNKKKKGGEKVKKLALISRKGGSGKTTLAVHLAVCAVQAGKFVVLIDLDPQGSASDWYEMRGASKEFVTVKATPEALPDILERAKENGADLAIIDTVPHTDKAALIAANNVDFVLVPCRTSAFDLKALPATFDLLSLSNTEAAIVLNNAPPIGNLAEETAKHLQNKGYVVFPAVISQRVAFSHAVSDGRAVHEYEPEGKAAAEIARLWDNLKEIIANDLNS